MVRCFYDRVLIQKIMRKAFLSVLLLVFCNITHAQQADEKPSGYRNALTVNICPGYIAGYFSISAAVAYEYYFMNHALSLSLRPAVYTGGQINFGEFDNGEIRSNISGFYIAPGIHGHFTEHVRGTNLGIGISIPLGKSNHKDRQMPAYGYGAKTYETSGLFAAILGELTICTYKEKGLIIGGYISAGQILSQAQPAVAKTQDSPLYIAFGLRIGGAW